MKHLIQFGVVLAVFLSVLPAAPARAHVTTGQPPSAIFNITKQTAAGLLCVGAASESNGISMQVVLQPCYSVSELDNPYNKWKFVYINQSGWPAMQIKNVGDGRCLHVGFGPDTWPPAHLFPCYPDSLYYQWRGITIADYGISQLVNQGTLTCLDVRNGVIAAGTVIQSFPCSGQSPPNPAQQFALFRRS